MHLSILIISYNTRDETLACLRSVFEQTSGAFEVIVLDNASRDGSADAIAEAFPQVRLIRSERNVGFARGNNLAAAEARGAWLLLLNPDTVILDRGVDAALAFARARPAGQWVIGGRTFLADGTLNASSCHGLPTPWSLACMGTGLASLFRGSRLLNPEGLGRWARDSAREVGAVTGCFLMLSRSLWDRLGGFDESFFMYGEDTDLCIRARGEGARCVICPEATLIHHGGRSEKVRADKMVRLFRAKVQLFEKHWRPAWVAFGIRMLQLWAGSRMAAMWIAMKLGRDQRAAYEAWRDVLRRRGEYGRSMNAEESPAGALANGEAGAGETHAAPAGMRG